MPSKKCLLSQTFRNFFILSKDLLGTARNCAVRRLEDRENHQSEGGVKGAPHLIFTLDRIGRAYGKPNNSIRLLLLPRRNLPQSKLGLPRPGKPLLARYIRIIE